MGSVGWQQPAIPRSIKSTCPHIGLMVAALTIGLHAEGHEWICSCGKKYMIVSNGGKDKRLVPALKEERHGELSE